MESTNLVIHPSEKKQLDHNSFKLQVFYLKKRERERENGKIMDLGISLGGKGCTNRFGVFCLLWPPGWESLTSCVALGSLTTLLI